MPFTVTMPKLSPTMEEGTIAKWHKKEDDHVDAGELLIEVATDKATVEYNALDEGYLREILVEDGGVAKVNQAIGIFTETADESIEGYKPEGISLEEEKEEVPQEGEPVEEKVPAPTQGPAMGMPAFVPEPPLDEYEFEMPREGIADRILASPLARKLAKEKGIDLTSIKGSGPGGRIMTRDLDLGLPDVLVTFGRKETPHKAPGSYEEEPLSPMRKIVGQRLQESKTFIPHFYVHQDVSADSLFDSREQLKRFGLKVTYNDFVIRACALALKEHPNVNSGFNSVNQTIIHFKTIDISMAVTVEGGLITPIIRHADYKDLGEISTQAKELAVRAKKGKLLPHEYKGGSFTVSNLGMFGVTDFVAVINPPQSAILAVGGIEEKPVVKNGQIVPGKIMKITLSCDHRVVDGAQAGIFIKTVQKYLENPSLLLI